MHNDGMKVYQFRMWGKKIAVDIKSGNFFEVDAPVSEALSLLHRYPKEKVAEALRRNYGPKKADTAISNISRLMKAGLLCPGKSQESGSVTRGITDLTLNIVNGCNLRCRYCWNENGAYGSRFGVKKLMHRSTAFKAVDLLLKESKGANDLVVDFYGGEPLMNFDLMRDVIGHCRQKERRRHVRFRFLLATNGTLLDKEKAEFLIDNGVDIAVSLDGNAKIQDKQRPFSGGKGSFGQIMRNLDALSPSYRNRLVGRATFTPYSTRIIRTFNFLRGLGFDRIELCESEKAGYGLESSGSFFFSGGKGIRQLKSLYYKLAKFYAKEMLDNRLTYRNTYFNRFFKQLSRLYHIQSVVGTCSAGFSLMSVDIDGSVYPCTAFVGLPQFRIGSVDKGIDELSLKGFSDVKISSNKACDSCWAKRICRGCGSCYNLNYFSNKSLGQPDPYYCELFRYKTKLMMAMIATIDEKDRSMLEAVLIPEYYARRGRKQKAGI